MWEYMGGPSQWQLSGFAKFSVAGSGRQFLEDVTKLGLPL